MSEKSARIKKLAVMAMLVALSIVLVSLVHFPIFAPVYFLEYDPADIPILIGTFAYGPVAGVILTVVASLIQGLTVSAQSGVMGIAMHIFATTTLVLVAGIIYRIFHTRWGAVLALVAGTLAMTVAMMAFNHFLTPYFITPDISDAAAVAANRAYVDTLLVPFIAPFNLIKAGVNSVITFGVYKVVSKYIVHGEGRVRGKKSASPRGGALLRGSGCACFPPRAGRLSFRRDRHPLNKALTPEPAPVPARVLKILR